MKQSVEISELKKKNIVKLEEYVETQNAVTVDTVSKIFGIEQINYECNELSFEIEICGHMHEDARIYFNHFMSKVNYPLFINDKYEFVKTKGEKFKNIELNTLILLTLFLSKNILLDGNIKCDTDIGQFVIDFNGRAIWINPFIEESLEEEFDTTQFNELWKY